MHLKKRPCWHEASEMDDQHNEGSINGKEEKTARDEAKAGVAKAKHMQVLT